jgi:uncharacterized protein YbjT (DUF2867 family)
VILKSKDVHLVQVHETWPERLADACSNAPSVERLIHVSCLGADPTSPSPRLASQGRGELALQQAFPDATIMRCGPLVGVEDRFYNDLALWRFSNYGVPVIDGGANKVQPVYVVDVAEAIYRSLEFDDSKGSTFELGGPSVMTCANSPFWTPIEVFVSIPRITHLYLWYYQVVNGHGSAVAFHTGFP